MTTTGTGEINSLLQQGKLTEARKLCELLCKKYRNNNEVWLTLGSINRKSGLLDDAASCLRRAIEIKPDHAKAHLTLAEILQQLGDIDSALRAAETAVKYMPDYGAAYLFLGGLYGKTGNAKKAGTASRKAVELLPDNATAYINLGNVLQMQGSLSGAETCYRKALHYNPRLAIAHSSLGSLFVAQRRFDEAEVYLRRAVELQPDLADAHNNMGILQLSMRKLSKALASFERAIEISPDFAPAYANIGNIHMQRDDHRQAVTSYKKSIELAPDLVQSYIALGNLYREADDTDSAIAYYEKAISLQPDYALAHYNLGLVEEDIGNYQKALDCYRSANNLSADGDFSLVAQAVIYERTGDIDTAYDIVLALLKNNMLSVKLGAVFSRLCRYYDNCSDAIQYLENLASKQTYTRDEQAAIHFSLGELYDRAQHYDNAFRHFRIANAAKSANFEYNAAGDIQYITNIIDSSPESVIASLPRPMSPSNRPIFIFGMPRSGTTLVEQVISAHPQVYGAGELPCIDIISREIQDISGSSKPYPACLSELNQATIDALAKEYLDSLNRLDTGATHVTDKMPHNFCHLGLIHVLFPDAALIHVRRNPADTCLSCYFSNFGDVHAYAYNLNNLACHYKQYKRLMEHWKNTLQLPILEVCYEDLVDNIVGTSRQIITYCGLEWDDRCLEFYENKRLIKTISYNQVRHPIYTRSKGRWKNYKKHIQPLLELVNDRYDG